MHHVLHGLAANPSLPTALVDRLIAVADADLAGELAARTDLSRAQARALAAISAEAAVALAYAGHLTAADVHPVTRPTAALALLDKGAGRPEWARMLAADPEVGHREKLAACPGLPADVVDGLAADPDVRVVAELALWATPEVAARLAEHPHAEVRLAVAANEAAPPAVLSRLIGGEGLAPARRCLVCDREVPPFVHDPHCPRLDCDLRAGAACDGSHQSTVRETQLAALQNPATPAEAVLRFADDPSALPRTALAARHDLPAHTARRLADDPVPGVRAALAENPAIDEALIRVLARDEDPDVRRAVAHHPRVPLGVLTGLAGALRIGPALLPRIAAATPAEVAELAVSPRPEVRMFLAARRDLPDGIRDALADDPDAKVVKSVASHPGLSRARLRAMVDRCGAQVAAMVAANPDAPPSLLEEVSRQRPPVRKALRVIARHPRATAAALAACLADDRARPLAAAHPALPPQLVAELLHDGDPQVTEAAAANPSLPRPVMEALVREGGGA
ncbi:hypothetical protein [Streptomyces sp. JB150]|uniref:hypothetical protein n=1 Tax=Streptomyces sp. JB150 TaxID=2714844 RepID=UPI0014080303|nr:hypothetical protein [Streptomyces sp. JB150]QIJ66268.1 hypothetical protein G7Z13_32840 [Streptomyces sp. JB150]